MSEYPYPDEPPGGGPPPPSSRRFAEYPERTEYSERRGAYPERREVDENKIYIGNMNYRVSFY